MERRLVAILAADLVGYTHLMGLDEAGTLRRLTRLRKQVLQPLISRYHGRIVKLMGDGLLVEFASVVEALACALAWQRSVTEHEADGDAETQFQFRIGINLGDVIIEAGDIHGDGVNIAARLEGLADPGGICLSGDAYRQTKGKTDAKFEDMGNQDLKNVAEPVRVYRCATGPLASTAPSSAVAHLPLADKPSIAVLPFTNLSGDPEQEYFSDGLTEDIITELSRFREFTVIARNSVFQYKGQSPKIKDVGHELAVRYIVEGSVRRSGKRVRVTSQLSDVETNTHIWAERFDRNLDDIFAIQDEVTASVVARVDDRIKGSGAMVLRTRQKPKITAYDLVLQSRPYRTQITRSSSERAAKLLEQAIAIDPNCAQAYAGLAFVRAGEYVEGWSSNPEAALRVAQSIAKKAVALDKSDGYTHASLAYVYYLSGDIDRAVHEAQVALDLNPNHVNIIMTNGWISVVAGDPEIGIEHIEHARQLNPNMPGFELWTLGEAYLDARRYQEAIETLSKVPDPPTSAHLEMAICFAYLGQEENARNSLNTYLDLARVELDGFPGEDPQAWRTFLERTTVRRQKQDVEHFIEGARKAGLPV